MVQKLIGCQQEVNEITINLKNIFLMFRNRRFFIIKIFFIVLAFFITITFISVKKWTVTADLYINKTNNTNFMEVNPFAMDDMGKFGSMLGTTDPLADEIELIQSPKVIDNVIKENNLKYKKIFDLIPTAKTGEYWTTEKFLKKKVTFESKKGTNIMEVSYTSKDKDEAYNVVNSIIKNYIALHQEINSGKAKSDKTIIESEYKKAKAELDKKVNSASGLPSTSLAGAGNLAALSAFYRSAQNALANIKGQYVAGEKSRIAVSESAAKVSQLAQKLEWANLVDEMSDSSKVLVIKEPYPLRDWEYSSPKLLINILLGIVFGIIFSIIGVVYKELTDKNLSYSMLGNNVIYDVNKELKKLKSILFVNKQEKMCIITFEKIPAEISTKLQDFRNISIKQADLSEKISEDMLNAEKFVLFEKINSTDTEDYKLGKQMIEDLNKEIICEVLL